MQIAFPFEFDEHGRIASADEDEHVRQMIEQVLFTEPGERVNRPEFGCGLRRLVFAAASDEVITATQALVHASLQRWLGDLIEVESVMVNVRESELTVDVQYGLNKNQQRHAARFVR